MESEMKPELLTEINYVFIR
jgi:hypothetical protein